MSLVVSSKVGGNLVSQEVKRLRPATSRAIASMIVLHWVNPCVHLIAIIIKNGMSDLLLFMAPFGLKIQNTR